MKIAAFDIGGTALKMGVMTRDGRLLESAKQSINDSDGDHILQVMLSWLAAHPSCEGVAISAPGYVDPHSGFITMGGAIRRFDNFAMKAWLEARTGLPVSVENDANHQLVHGARFRAGEFGYMLTDRHGGRDPRRYSMNENCTLRVLRHRYAEHIAAPLESVTGEMIFDRYDAGDPVCQRLVAEFFNGLGHGLYNLVNIFDPQAIFIGGGIVERPGFLALLRQHLAWFGIADSLDTVSHGNDAGLIGAVYHFNQHYRSPGDDRH